MQDAGTARAPGRAVTVQAADGFVLDAYLVEPAGQPRGGVVILQEIFGVNSHIRSVADRYAAAGYLAIAPALFDRAERKIELGYSEHDVEIGRDLMRRVGWTEVVADVEAAGRMVASAGKVGIVGFCWGGTAAWVTASRCTGFACAVSYYGNAIPTVLADRPRIPMQLHWGEQDHLIAVEDIRRVAQAAPDTETHLYPTGHGFNCDQRSLYHADSARIAQERTFAFLQRHMA